MVSRSDSDILKAPSTLSDLAAYHASRYRHADMLNARNNGRWEGFSSQGFFEYVKQTGLGLYSIGVRFGERVAILSENTPLWVISDFAITSIGAVTVPIYTTQVASQVEYILLNSGATTFIISSRALYDRVQSVLERVPLKRLIVIDATIRDPHSQSLKDVQARGEALEREQPGLYAALCESVTPAAVASIIYTSGTTGEPKGVALTHRNLISNAVDASSVNEWFPRTDKAFSYLPLSHIFERTLLNIYLYRGVRVYFAESVEMIPRDLLEVHPTIMATVPRLLEKVFDKIRQKGAELSGVRRGLFDWSMRIAKEYNPEGSTVFYSLRHAVASILVFSKWRKAIGGRFRFIISGGAALPYWLGKIYHAAGITILQGYGLTETSPVISVNRLKRNRLGTVGPLIPNVEVRTAQDGELLVRGPNVMKEFYNAPAETAAVFEDSWFHTGDLGHLDDDGFLIITGRKRDLIKKSTGKFVAPEPIEARLLECKYIEYIVLIGEGRKFILAVIFPNFPNLRELVKKDIPGAPNRELVRLPEVVALFQDAIDSVNTVVNPWEHILRFLLVEDEATIASGDLTPTLKLRRTVIEEKYKNQIAQIYEEFEQTQEIPG